ncbi:MAG TPA: zinc ribbon domain-containing protein [Candidatus Binataceae bacterium]|nr:zinc ribbon domain-containing protein [Candidatus Binataceae bacterium]
MPLYECRCERCELTFEVLAPLSASRMRSRPCPECGRPARRIISAVSFALGGARASESDGAPSRDRSRPDVTKLKVPPSARLCWMDDRSAARLAAYKHGRGAEYDDVVAAREEKRKQRGEPQPAAHAHSHSHSPLSDPVVFKHRAEAAARRAKVAESKDVARRPLKPA